MDLIEYCEYIGVQLPQQQLRNSPMILGAIKLFERFPITHTYCLTYSIPRSADQRRHAFTEWVDAIEWLQRSHLGWLRADEGFNWSGVGKPCQSPHHHGVLVSAPNLDIRTAEHLWHSSYGDALVTRYERSGGAVGYALKIAHTTGEWEIGGIKAFIARADGAGTRLPGSIGRHDKFCGLEMSTDSPYSATQI